MTPARAGGENWRPVEAGTASHYFQGRLQKIKQLKNQLTSCQIWQISQDELEVLPL